MRKACKRIAALVLCTALLAAGALCAVSAAVPDTFTIQPGGTLSIASMPWLTEQKKSGTAPAGAASADASANVTLALFGVVPVKTVRTVQSTERTVNVCGTPFGIKMFSNGALVVGFTDLYTLFGSENPAKEAGLRLGDLIVSANGHSVRTNEELSQVITQAAGAPITIVFQRGTEQKSCSLTPVPDSSSGAWKAGVWVRDSSAGIGTLTFTDNTTRRFAGLGHAISDTDTGADIPLLSGEIVPVTITGCVAGTAGSPGELRGEFDGGQTLGTVLANDVSGVYGTLNATLSGTEYPVANEQEVVPGDAQILATISGTVPKLYGVRIERVNLNAGDPNRNMLIRVTDPELLNKTGGIVQGMSGSPVLQNGKLVGAVTHVLVNNPARGYAIFAQTMLKEADACGKTG